ncbi:MAG: alpha/beta fold hydrolase [Rhodoblastus sp.]
MIPVVFDNCRGWLHPGASRRGVIICGAHGFEDLCARSSLRLLAEQLSRQGLPTLRFDWRGTADSEGDGDAPHRVATWLGNIGEAVRKLVEMTGVEEVALVGVRLGALLALEAARDIQPARLVLLAPPASGRALKRELEVMSKIFQGKPGADDDAFDGVSAAGFRISRATLDDLKLVGSRRISGARNCATLVLSQNPEGAPLAEKLRETGADVTVEPFEGYAEMMCDPTAALAPVKAIRRIVDFVAEGATATHKVGPAPDASAEGATLATDVWREEAAQFGPANRLVGIFCTPADNGAHEKAVVFLNSGGVYHIGWARMFVDMARHLARSGVASLRMDLSGVGDSLSPRSLSPQGPERAPLFDRSLTRDVEAAVDWLFSNGIREVALFGACSGAYQAFHAAIEDKRVKRIALVNQACFIYGPTYAMQIEAWRRTKAADIAMKLASFEGAAENAPGGARALLFSLAKKVAKAGLAHATDATYALRRRVPGLNMVERWFSELSSRGAEVLLIYSENDPGLSELERHLGARSHDETPLPGVYTKLIADTDHELTPQSARAAVSAALDDFIAGRAAA